MSTQHALTIPATWTTASSCLTSGDVWHWDDGATDVDAFGSPAETSSCYPPDYTPTLGFAYTADACPDGFTAACTTDYYSDLWTTVCCPSGTYTFSCAFESFSSLTFGCRSTYTTSSTLSVTGVSVDDDITTTGSPYVATRQSGDKLLALAIGITSTGSTQSSSTSSGSSSSSSAAGSATSTSTPSTSARANSAAAAGSSSGELSAGAAAGIGVGVGIGIILIALGGWFLYRRGVHKGRSAEADPTVHPSQQQQQQQKHTSDQHYPKPELAGYAPEYTRRVPSELQDATPGSHEMDGTRELRELP